MPIINQEAQFESNAVIAGGFLYFVSGTKLFQLNITTGAIVTSQTIVPATDGPFDEVAATDANNTVLNVGTSGAVPKNGNIDMIADGGSLFWQHRTQTVSGTVTATTAQTMFRQD